MPLNYFPKLSIKEHSWSVTKRRKTREVKWNELKKQKQKKQII